MRFKLVPSPPDSLEFVADAQRAVPLVPGTEDDCCARLMRRLDLPSRDVARTWLTFLRALELADERDSGFVRRQRAPTPEHVRESFLDRVFVARETLETLSRADGPLAADAVFERLESTVPQWEHHKNPSGWRDTWRERVADILEWLCLLDLAAVSTAKGQVAYVAHVGSDAAVGADGDLDAGDDADADHEDDADDDHEDDADDDHEDDADGDHEDDADADHEDDADGADDGDSEDDGDTATDA